MQTFAEKAIKYFTSLKVTDNLPFGIEIANPYKSKDVKRIVKKFFKKYFNDNNKRILICGINPGRFGGGLTGISFTDPVALKEECGIENNLGLHRELSSRFIYKFINIMDGVENFYKKYYITALYPLALLKEGKNYNYYDNIHLYNKLRPLIIDALKKQIDFGVDRTFIVSLGKKNSVYLKNINDEFGFFKEVRFVEHPRYIMQYKLKEIDSYLDKYRNVLF
jgi:hypothetical protein